MVKIILITFAFMAFAFYEMSGGDAFVPIADEKRAALEAVRIQEERVLAEAKAEQLKAAPEPVQLVLASAVVTPLSEDFKTELKPADTPTSLSSPDRTRFSRSSFKGT